MSGETGTDTGTDRGDPFGLQRFVDAQGGIYSQALSELRRGQKRSHWIWYVFPQLDGLGSSATTRHYAIKSIAEARAYLAHRLLGGRLVECTEAVLAVTGRTASEIFGYPDDLKFQSSMTLFEAASGPDSLFERALERYFDGERDARTLELLKRGSRK